MFDDHVSTPEVDSAGAFDCDPRRCPVDALVRHMRRQTLIPDPHSRPPPRPARLDDGQETTIPPATIEPSSESSMHLEHQKRQPLLDSKPTHSYSYQTSGEQIHTYQTANDAPYTSSDTQRLRPQRETRHCKSSSSLRTLDLVTDMIENGVQCTVRSSTPPPAPIPASQSIQLVCSGPIEPQVVPDQDMYEEHMDLEVDLGYYEQDDEEMLNEALALRHAGAPAGVNKLGFLRYRSSTEAALACKNMKRSVPRVRRRRKNKSSAPTALLPNSTAV